jgi:hypothetical protein
LDSPRGCSRNYPRGGGWQKDPPPYPKVTKSQDPHPKDAPGVQPPHNPGHPHQTQDH